MFLGLNVCLWPQYNIASPEAPETSHSSQKCHPNKVIYARTDFTIKYNDPDLYCFTSRVNFILSQLEHVWNFPHPRSHRIRIHRIILQCSIPKKNRRKGVVPCWSYPASILDIRNKRPRSSLPCRTCIEPILSPNSIETITSIMRLQFNHPTPPSFGVEIVKSHLKQPPI